MELVIVLGCYAIIINLAAFAIFAMDKRAAVKNRRRVPEAKLIGLTALGGTVGGLLAMYLFHHKTRKKIFSIGIPLIMMGQITAVLLLMKFL